MQPLEINCNMSPVIRLPVQSTEALRRGLDPNSERIRAVQNHAPFLIVIGLPGILRNYIE
jgi:hypothetical protein